MKQFLYGLTEGFGMAIMFGAIVVVFVVALTEWLVALRGMP